MTRVQEALDTAHPTLEAQISALSDQDHIKTGPLFPTHLPSSGHQRASSGGSIQHITAKQPTDDILSADTSSNAGDDTKITSVTYSGQTELPPLPIPSLEETLNKFLKSLEALFEYEEQRQSAQRVVLEFLQGDGPQLQNLLLEYDRQGREKGWIGSYVEEFWTDAYLAPDSSVVLVRVVSDDEMS
ncbi:MAG: hypothetical protein SGILL_009676, partial [Bacillariaceae sp.]